MRNGQVTPYQEGIGRKFWDSLFRQTGRHVNGLTVVNFLAWLALRLFGWISWRKKRRRNDPIEIPEGMTLQAGPPQVR